MRLPELLRLGLAAQRRSALVWALVLLALTGSVIAVWPAMQESGSLDSLVTGMPPELVAALGLEALGSPTGFLHGNLYALVLPLLFGALGILHTTALTAGDEDAGRLELLLALPVRRDSVYLGRFLAVVLVLAVAAVLVGLVVAGTGAALDMGLELGGVVGASTALFLLGVVHAGLAVALAGVGLRANVVLAASFGVLVLGYLVDALLPMIDALGDVAAASPWHWALGDGPLEHGLDGLGVVLLVVSSVVLVAIGVAVLRWRTIRTA